MDSHVQNKMKYTKIGRKKQRKEKGTKEESNEGRNKQMKR